jgi:hypothetical protein
MNFTRWKALEYRRGTGGKGAHVERQDDVLRYDVTANIQYRATGVLRLANDRRIAGAEEGILHLLHDTGEAGLDDLECDGIDGHA